MNEDAIYQKQLAQEAEAWGSESERMAGVVPPDWRFHRNLRHNVIIHAEQVKEHAHCPLRTQMSDYDW